MELNDTQSEELKRICNRFEVQNLYLFGSATGKAFNIDKSDIDLVVEFNENLQPINFADNYFSLLNSLEKLFNRKVDLISYRALKNPIIIEEIEKSKILLYAA